MTSALVSYPTAPVQTVVRTPSPAMQIRGIRQSRDPRQTLSVRRHSLPPRHSVLPLWAKRAAASHQSCRWLRMKMRIVSRIPCKSCNSPVEYGVRPPGRPTRPVFLLLFSALSISPRQGVMPCPFGQQSHFLSTADPLPTKYFPASTKYYGVFFFLFYFSIFMLLGHFPSLSSSVPSLFRFWSWCPSFPGFFVRSFFRCSFFTQYTARAALFP